MTHFERLEASGIPLDWTTILLGWDGFGELFGMITTPQLQSYGMDQIGYGPEEEFALVSGIAFADEGDTWTIRACLKQLASETPEAKDRAERVWRWLMLSDVVTNLTKNLKTVLDPNIKSDDPYAVDVAAIDVWVDLREFWSEFDYPAERFRTPLDWKKSDWSSELWRMQAILEEHRDFLSREEAALREAPIARHP